MNRELLIVNFGVELERTNLLKEQKQEVTKLLIHSIAECDKQEITLLSSVFVNRLSDHDRDEMVNIMDVMHNKFMKKLRKEIESDVETRKCLEEMSRNFKDL